MPLLIIIRRCCMRLINGLSLQIPLSTGMTAVCHSCFIYYMSMVWVVCILQRHTTQNWHMPLEQEWHIISRFSISCHSGHPIMTAFICALSKCLKCSFLHMDFSIWRNCQAETYSQKIIRYQNEMLSPLEVKCHRQISLFVNQFPTWFKDSTLSKCPSIC